MRNIMPTQDVEKVVLILKLLQDARNIDRKYNELPAIIANRDMIIGCDEHEGLTLICISYGEYRYQIVLSYQDMYYEGFDGMETSRLIQGAINNLVNQSQNPKENNQIY